MFDPISLAMVGLATLISSGAYALVSCRAVLFGEEINQHHVGIRKQDHTRSQ